MFPTPRKIIGRALLGIVAACLIAACGSPIAQTDSASQALSRAVAPGAFRIVGYSASWRGTAQEIDYAKLTHVIYAFAIPDAQGNIISLENTAKLQSIVSLAHPRGVKVSLAVGGWSYNGAELDGTFEQLAANPSARANLKTRLLALVDQYGLDGIDMDWEYPDAGTSSADNYTALMTELSAGLKAKGKLLSAAVCASGWAGNAVAPSVMNAVDFLNIMAYDGDAGAGHSPMSYATGALDFWVTQRGLPAAKANLGVPFYARPSWKAYDELVPLAPSVVPYTDYYNGDYYNGIPTIKEKTKLAMQRAGGIMIWELSHDTTDATSLLAAIYSQAGNNPVDTQAPSVPGNPSVSNIASGGATVSWTASTDNVGVAVYVVSGAGTSQTLTSTSATLTGLSASTNYTVSVTARDAAGNTSPAASVSFKTLAPATDTQAPTVPGIPSVSNISASGATLSWAASTDNVGVAAYELVKAGAVIATVAGTSANLSGLAASTPYSVSVRAKDAAGNASALSGAVSFTTLSDTNTDPVLATGLPGTPNIQQDNWDGGASFGINMNMWWGNNGTRFELFENGVLVASVTLKDNSPNAQSASVKFTGKAKGSYKYVGKLTNKFGTTSSGELTYTVR